MKLKNKIIDFKKTVNFHQAGNNHIPEIFCLYPYCLEVKRGFNYIFKETF
jgi:hypothetical protein